MNKPVAHGSYAFLAHLVFFCLTLLLGPSSWAGDSATASMPDTAKAYAHVWRIRGLITAQDNTGATRVLQENAPVFIGERIHAANTGEAVLKTRDAGLIALRPGSELVVERFAAEGKATDHQTLRLLTGSLRLITGWIGYLNPVEHRVITPSATIGIRGTDHEPYVLPPELASTAYRQGTYDKVNRGATALEANGRSLLIDRGRVGFARDPATAPGSRALISLLLPVLLAKVPEFYVPGSFDEELNRYAANADSLSQQALEALQNTSQPGPEIRPVGPVSDCRPIAEAWLARLEQAILRRDAPAITALFSPGVIIQVTVPGGDKQPVTLSLERAELAQSILAAIKDLSHYEQHRMSLDVAAESTDTACRHIEIRTVVTEQGIQAGRPYRIESLETYRLEAFDGNWLATRAETIQR